MYKFENDLEKLKALLIKHDNFKEIFEFFFDHLGENAEFLHVCKEGNHPNIKKVLETIGEAVYGGKVSIKHLVMGTYPKPEFYHGVCFVQGRPASLFFFQDIDMGIIAIPGGTPDAEIKFIRFSTIPIDKSQMDVNEIFPFPVKSSNTMH